MKRHALLVTGAGVLLLVIVEFVFLSLNTQNLFITPPPPAAEVTGTAAPIPARDLIAQLPPGFNPKPTASPPPPTATPAPPTPIPAGPQAVSGVPIDALLIMPEDVRANMRATYQLGQALGNNPRAFSMIGDSTIESPFFLAPFDDSAAYVLGDYSYLQPVIDYFTGSFGRQSIVVRRGQHAWTALDPMWADDNRCQPQETPIACEYRLHRPSVVFVELGANDSDVLDLFDESLREIVRYSLSSGVIPVLSTRAQPEDSEVLLTNVMIRQIALDYQVPLWDYGLIAHTMPTQGLSNDGIHLTMALTHDYTRPEAFQRGHSVHNLVALIMLDRIWRSLITP